MKSDKRKFKDKPFINRWSASQIKHITAKTHSKLMQKFFFDIDYQSFAVDASLFVSRCRRSRWRFSATSIWRVHFRAIFELFRGFLRIVVNVKVNKYHFFGKCNTSLISRVPIFGFSWLRFVVMKKSCCRHSTFHGVVQQKYPTFLFCIISSFNSSTTL